MRSRCTITGPPAVTISPLFGDRANSATPRSISSTLRTPIGVSSTPRDDATDWMAPKCLGCHTLERVVRSNHDGRDLRHCGDASITGHGDPRQADCGWLAVAEWVCGEADRHDPTGMSRPHDRLRGGAPAPDPWKVCDLL